MKPVEKPANDLGEWNCPSRRTEERLVVRRSLLELAVNRREHTANGGAESKQDRNGDHRDKREDQRIFHEGLTLASCPHLQSRGVIHIIEATATFVRFNT